MSEAKLEAKVQQAALDFRAFIVPTEMKKKKGKSKITTFDGHFSNWVGAAMNYNNATGIMPDMDEFLVKASFPLLLRTSVGDAAFAPIVDLLQTFEDMFLDQLMTLIVSCPPETYLVAALDLLLARDVATLPNPFNDGLRNNLYRRSLVLMLGMPDYTASAMSAVLCHPVTPTPHLPLLAEAIMGVARDADLDTVYPWLLRTAKTSPELIIGLVGLTCPVDRLVGLIKYRDAQGIAVFHQGLHKVIADWLAEAHPDPRAALIDAMRGSGLPGDLAHDALFRLMRAVGDADQTSAIAVLRAAVEAGAPLDLTQVAAAIRTQLSVPVLTTLLDVAKLEESTLAQLSPVWTGLAGYYEATRDAALIPVFCRLITTAATPDATLDVGHPAIVLLLHMSSAPSPLTDVAVTALLTLTVRRPVSTADALIRSIQPYLLRPILLRCVAGAVSQVDAALLRLLVGADPELLHQAVVYWFETASPARRLEGSTAVPTLLRLLAPDPPPPAVAPLGLAFVYLLRATIDPSVAVRTAAATGIRSLGPHMSGCLAWTSSALFALAEPAVQQAILKTCLACSARHLPPLAPDVLLGITRGVRDSIQAADVIKDNCLALAITLTIQQAARHGVPPEMAETIALLIETADRLRGPLMACIIDSIARLAAADSETVPMCSDLIDLMIDCIKSITQNSTPSEIAEAVAMLDCLAVMTRADPDHMGPGVEGLLEAVVQLVERPDLPRRLTVAGLAVVEAVFTVHSLPPVVHVDHVECRALVWLERVGALYSTAVYGDHRVRPTAPATPVTAAFRAALAAVWRNFIGEARTVSTTTVSGKTKKGKKAPTPVTPTDVPDDDAPAVAAVLASVGPAAVQVMADVAAWGPGVGPVENGVLKLLGLAVAEDASCIEALDVMARITAVMPAWRPSDSFMTQFLARVTLMCAALVRAGPTSAVAGAASPVARLAIACLSTVDPNDPCIPELVGALVALVPFAELSARDIQRVIALTAYDEARCLTVVSQLTTRITQGLVDWPAPRIAPILRALRTLAVDTGAPAPAAVTDIDQTHPLPGPVLPADAAVSTHAVCAAVGPLLVAPVTLALVSAQSVTAGDVDIRTELVGLALDYARIGVVTMGDDWVEPDTGKGAKGKKPKAKGKPAPADPARLAWLHLCASEGDPLPPAPELSADPGTITLLAAMATSPSAGVRADVGRLVAGLPAVLVDALTPEVCPFVAVLLSSLASHRIGEREFAVLQALVEEVIVDPEYVTREYGSGDPDAVREAIIERIGRE